VGASKRTLRLERAEEMAVLREMGFVCSAEQLPLLRGRGVLMLDDPNVLFEAADWTPPGKELRGDDPCPSQRSFERDCSVDGGQHQLVGVEGCLFAVECLEWFEKQQTRYKRVAGTVAPQVGDAKNGCFASVTRANLRSCGRVWQRKANVAQEDREYV
jgi:hypothetical protein